MQRMTASVWDCGINIFLKIKDKSKKAKRIRVLRTKNYPQGSPPGRSGVGFLFK